MIHYFANYNPVGMFYTIDVVKSVDNQQILVAQFSIPEYVIKENDADTLVQVLKNKLGCDLFRVTEATYLLIEIKEKSLNK